MTLMVAMPWPLRSEGLQCQICCLRSSETSEHVLRMRHDHRSHDLEASADFPKLPPEIQHTALTSAMNIYNYYFPVSIMASPSDSGAVLEMVGANRRRSSKRCCGLSRGPHTRPNIRRDAIGTTRQGNLKAETCGKHLQRLGAYTILRKFSKTTKVGRK